MQNIRINTLSIQDKYKLRNFIKKNWSTNHLFTKDEKIFNFQYLYKNKFTFLVAKKKSEIFGVQGYIDYLKYNKIENFKQIFLAFWCVKENSNFGIGLNLHNKIMNLLQPSFVGIVGINTRALKLHQWLGFKVFKMSHYVFISPFKKKFKIIKFKNLSKISLKNKRIFKTKFIEIKKSNINKLINNDFYKIQTPLKSNKYILERYLKHPIYKYLIFLSLNDNNKPCSLFVLRKIDHNSSNIIKLIDVIGDNKYLRSFDEIGIFLFKKFESEYIDFYSHGIPKKYFKNTLFIECQNQNMIIPNHFEPFEQKNIDIFCAYKNNGNFKNIKIFRSDGDGDRPSRLY